MKEQHGKTLSEGGGQRGGRDYVIVWHRKCEATRCNYGNIQSDEGVSRSINSFRVKLLWHSDGDRQPEEDRDR